MGKRAKQKRARQAKLLTARLSRVEKSRRAQRACRSLPPWFFRVDGISLKEDREVNPSDFDEDLSEWEEDKKKTKEEKRIEDELEWEGSDADYYYELKYQREERKQEVQQERKEKNSQREMEGAKEEEFRAAYQSLRNAKKEHKRIPIESLADQGFDLFCSDHVDHCYSEVYPTKRVEFYHLNRMGNALQDNQKDGNDADMLYGDVYLSADAGCNFGPIRAPRRARRKAIKAKSEGGKYELSFQFIGNGYLKLRVSREMVFMNRYTRSPPGPLPDAPDVFEFVGIWRDWKKEAAEEAERYKMLKARRSPSPRESWFDMNHPMGWWAQSRWGF